MANAFEELMLIRDNGPHPSPIFSESAPVYTSPFRLSETAAAILGATGQAVNDVWQLKTGRPQKFSVATRQAAAALNDAEYLEFQQPDGSFLAPGDSPAAQVAYGLIRPYPTRDGRWFLPHFGMRHLKERVLKVLGCSDGEEEIARAVARWDAQDLEDAIADSKACGGIVRSYDEWLAHPHGKALSAQAVVEIEKIGDSEPEPFAPEGRALEGIRVLDLTRILAGPVAARTLAEQGADVLMVAAKGLPQIRKFVIDLSHGKRSCFLDLNSPEGAGRLRELIKTADVFSQGYRPGSLEARGFGPEYLAALRPGIIYTSINCYGQKGPFSDRAGWEQVAQAVTGICHAGGDTPALLPVPACDYMTGYLGAYGSLLALARRAREGGSYHVKVSLCQSAMFLYRQGFHAEPVTGSPLSREEIQQLQVESETSYGRLRHLGPIVSYSETRPYWDKPSPALGGDAPVWLAKD